MVSKQLLGVILGLFMISLASALVSIDSPINTDYGKEVKNLTWSTDINTSLLNNCWYILNSGANTPINCDDLYLTQNISSIEGDNTWEIYTNDTSGNIETDNVDFWVDSISPVINWIVPATNPIAWASDTINLQISYVETNPKNIEFEIYDSLGDKKFSLFDSILPFTTSTSKSSLIDGEYMCYVTIKDTINHETTISNKVYIDNKAPTYSNIQTQFDNIYAPGKDYEFSIAFSDALSGMDSAWIVLDGTTYSSTESSGIYTATITDLAAGDHTYTWYGRDKAGNVNNTGALVYTVEKAITSLSLDASPSWNNDYLTTTTITGNDCPSQITCVLERDSAGVLNPDTRNLDAGTYVYVYSTIGNQNYTSDSVTNDLTINQISPITRMLITGTSPVVYGTASDFAGSETNVGDAGCIYELFIDSVAVSNPDNVTYGIGTHTYAYNTSGCGNYLAGEISKNLIINKLGSSVELYINDSRNNLTINDSATISIDAIVTAGEAGVLIYNNGALIIPGDYLFDSVGTYNITAIHEETENYTSSSETFFVTVIDTIAPSITIASPTSITYDVSSIQLNVSSNETVSWEYSLNGAAREDFSSEDFLSLANGDYNLIVYATDLAGNENSANVSFTIDVPSSSSSSSGGSSGSCSTIWNCTKWSKWDNCENNHQTRTCVAWNEVRCGQGLTFNGVKNLIQSQLCTSEVPLVNEENVPPAETEEQPSQGFVSRITGGVIGFAKSGSGMLTIIVVVALSLVLGVIHFIRRRNSIELLE